MILQERYLDASIAAVVDCIGSYGRKEGHGVLQFFGIVDVCKFVLYVLCVSYVSIIAISRIHFHVIHPHLIPYAKFCSHLISLNIF